MKNIFLYRLFYVIKDNFRLFLVLVFVLICSYYKYFRVNPKPIPIPTSYYTFDDFLANGIELHSGRNKIVFTPARISLPQIKPDEQSGCENNLNQFMRQRVTQYLQSAYNIKIDHIFFDKDKKMTYGELFFDGIDLSKALENDGLGCFVNETERNKFNTCDWCALYYNYKKTATGNK